MVRGGSDGDSSGSALSQVAGSAASNLPTSENRKP